MNHLDLIKFDTNEFGFQEIGRNGELLRLYSADGDQLDLYSPAKSWRHVKDLGEIDPEDSDTFWELVGDIEIPITERFSVA